MVDGVRGFRGFVMSDLGLCFYVRSLGIVSSSNTQSSATFRSKLQYGFIEVSNSKKLHQVLYPKERKPLRKVNESTKWVFSKIVFW